MDARGRQRRGEGGRRDGEPATLSGRPSRGGRLARCARAKSRETLALGPRVCAPCFYPFGARAPPLLQDFLKDFLAGGVSGAIAKTCTAPIERVKLIIQTQDANPRIISGEIPRYTGIGNCFSRVASEQGIGAFWRGNVVNIMRYFPTQAFNFAFKDSIKALFPKFSPKTNFAGFFAVNMASGGLAGALSLCIVYPLDYARTRLASDVGSGQRAFSGLSDCLTKTAKGPAARWACTTASASRSSASSRSAARTSA